MQGAGVWLRDRRMLSTCAPLPHALPQEKAGWGVCGNKSKLTLAQTRGSCHSPFSQDAVPQNILDYFSSPPGVTTFLYSHVLDSRAGGGGGISCQSSLFWLTFKLPLLAHPPC